MESSYELLGNERGTRIFKVNNDSLKLNEEFILNEASGINPTKRKKIEDLVYNVFDRLDPTGANTKKYKDLFNSMSNEKFNTWMKEFLRDDKRNFYLECLPNKNAPKIKNAVDALEYLKVPTEEYIYYRHDGNKDNPIRSRYKVPILYVDVRRLQQILSKKNTFSLDINKRNLKTGMLTGEDKIARISDMETYSLLSYKDDCIALKEFMSARADAMDAKAEMYKQISKQGYVYMKDIPDNISKKQALNTVNVLMLGAGIDNDLSVPDKTINMINKITKQ